MLYRYSHVIGPCGDLFGCNIYGEVIVIRLLSSSCIRARIPNLPYLLCGDLCAHLRSIPKISHVYHGYKHVGTANFNICVSGRMMVPVSVCVCVCVCTCMILCLYVCVLVCIYMYVCGRVWM